MTDSFPDQLLIDDQSLGKFKYKRELTRRLGFFGSFAIAFSAMSMTTGIFATYGFALKNCGPIAIWTWPIVALGQILVAAILSELAGRIPVCGYSYQWVTRLTHPAIGWLTGWLGIFFTVFGVAATNFGLAPIIAQFFGAATTSANLAIIVLFLVTVQALINMRGVNLTARLNNAAVYTEIFGMIGIAAAVIVGGLLLKGSVFHPVILFSFVPGMKTGMVEAVLLGSLMACWTLVAFEFAADLSEETLDATRIVPKALISSILVSALVGMLFLAVITLAIPDLNAIVQSENPIPDILKSALGRGLSEFFLVIVMVSMFACGTIAMTAGSRLIYSMARDNVFIFSPFFRKVSNKKVPLAGIVFVFFLNIFVIIFSRSFTDLLAASAILPILIYFITVGAYAFRSKHFSPVDTFHLGRWRNFLIVVSLLWLIVELGILTIPKEFHEGAKICLEVVLAGGLFYFILFHKKLVSGKAGIQDKYI